MPRSWSYRQVEHVDLHPAGKGGFPLAGWLIVGLGLLALAVYTVLAIHVMVHPVETPAGDSAPMSAER